MIVTANSWLNMTRDEYVRRIIYATMKRHGIRYYPSVDEGEPLKAFVNRGRWLVQCECGGAEHAWEEGLFICRSCFNSGHGHRVRLSVFPKDRAKIEDLLNVRPLDNRHWFPHESLADLRRENRHHKKELLEVT